MAADLANTTPLMEAVVQFLREFHLAPRSKQGPGPTSEPLVAEPQYSEPFVPEFVYEAMKLNKRFDLMSRGHQEDAEEFLGFFLDTLHEELLAAIQKSKARLTPANMVSKMSAAERKLNGVSETAAEETQQDDNEDQEREVARPVSPSEEGWMEVGQKGKTAFTRTTTASDSPITQIFGGKLRSVLRTPGAKDSVTLEPYQPLQLDIQPASVLTIEDALLNLTVPETIPGVFSPARGGPVDATKQVFIERAPPVLILHIKRFFYDEVGGVQKNSKQVGYGPTLLVGGDMVSPTKRSEGSIRYRLFGIVYHHGRYATGGHYTVDVSRQDGSGWVHFDDTVFHAVPGESVARKAGQASRDIGVGHDGLAYLLFYAREDALPGGHVVAPAASSGMQQKSRPAQANGSSASSSIAQRSANGSAGPSIANRYDTPSDPGLVAAPASNKSSSNQTVSVSGKQRSESKKIEAGDRSSASDPQTSAAPSPRRVPGAPPRKAASSRS